MCMYTYFAASLAVVLSNYIAEFLSLSLSLSFLSL